MIKAFDKEGKNIYMIPDDVFVRGRQAGKSLSSIMITLGYRLNEDLKWVLK